MREKRGTPITYFAVTSTSFREAVESSTVNFGMLHGEGEVSKECMILKTAHACVLIW